MTCPRMLAVTRLCVRGMSQSVRVLNEEGFREAAQRDKDSWDTMAAKVPTNHVEKNLYLLSQAARLTIDNTCLLPNPLRKKVTQHNITEQYHRTIPQNNNTLINTEQ